VCVVEGLERVLGVWVCVVEGLEKVLGMVEGF
jgi:hypothetical protein